MSRAEFEQQVRLNQEPLRRFLLNLCDGDASLGDDIAQEAFIKAYLNLNSFTGRSKFSTWLFRIAYNCFCDNKRAAKRFAVNEICDNKLISDEKSDSSFGNQELYMAMRQLNSNERTCVLLFYMEDKSIKEISLITGIKDNTIKSHLSRAKVNLSTHLKRIGYEG